MIPSLPQLRILPLDNLTLHEDHDRQRMGPLIEQLRAQGLLRNPPIVMPLEGGTGRYMVLDGANRVASLQEMGFPHIVAQVMQADDPRLNLQTWNHVVWGMNPQTLMRDIRKIKGLKAVKVDTEKSLEAPKYVPVHMRLANGVLYLLEETPSDLPTHIQTLHAIVNAYKTRASLDRTSQTLIDPFKNLYPDLTAVVIFPRFRLKTILKLAAQNIVLPSGVTRFAVSPRVLHMNYPLHELSSARPIEEKEAYLREWIQKKARNKEVRYYAEATFLFDE